MKQLKYLLVSALLYLFLSCQPFIKPTPPPSIPVVKVLLLKSDQTVSLRFKGPFVMRSREAIYELGKKNQGVTLTPTGQNFVIHNKNRYLTITRGEIVKFIPTQKGTLFMLNGRAYYGALHVIYRDNKLFLINQLNLEQYLLGVVPAEMPSAKKAYLQALKAQAIAARTYALRKLQIQPTALYHLTADHNDQVYQGASARTPLTDKAVLETRGLVLTFQGKPARIFYHSTCGGITEAAAHWDSTLREPYLPAVHDVVESRFACEISPKFRWQRSLSLFQLDSLILTHRHFSFLNQSVKDTSEVLLNIQIQARTPTGRVKDLRITYQDSSFTLTGYEIRSFFATNRQSPLPSTLFYLQQTSDSVIVIKGAGYGHGVGMCQWGSLQRSALGFSFTEILTRVYYPGTRITRMY